MYDYTGTTNLLSCYTLKWEQSKSSLLWMSFYGKDFNYRQSLSLIPWWSLDWSLIEMMQHMSLNAGKEWLISYENPYYWFYWYEKITGSQDHTTDKQSDSEVLYFLPSSPPPPSRQNFKNLSPKVFTIQLCAPCEGVQ